MLLSVGILIRCKFEERRSSRGPEKISDMELHDF